MAAERWLHPLGLLSGPAAFRAIGEGQALPLQGGDLAFSLARLVEDGREIATLPVAALPEEWGDEIEAVTARPAPFAGIAAFILFFILIMRLVPIIPMSGIIDNEREQLKSKKTFKKIITE